MCEYSKYISTVIIIYTVVIMKLTKDAVLLDGFVVVGKAVVVCRPLPLLEPDLYVPLFHLGYTKYV